MINRLGQNDAEVAEDLSILLHLKAQIAFEQFDDKVLRDIVIQVAQFFGKKGLSHADKLEIVDFICQMLDTREGNKLFFSENSKMWIFNTFLVLLNYSRELNKMQNIKGNT